MLHFSPTVLSSEKLTWLIKSCAAAFCLRQGVRFASLVRASPQSHALQGNACQWLPEGPGCESGVGFLVAQRSFSLTPVLA
eukprot:4770834-Amphidinium_carterae.1